MPHSDSYKNESQDARRHDQHKAAHPHEKEDKNTIKSERKKNKK